MTIARIVLPVDWPTPVPGLTHIPLAFIEDVRLSPESFLIFALLASYGEELGQFPVRFEDARLNAKVWCDGLTRLCALGWVHLVPGDDGQVAEYHLRVKASQ